MAPRKEHGNGKVATVTKAKDAPAEETVSLLFSPSPGSTTRPSVTNPLDYGAVEAGKVVEEEEEPLIQMRLSQTNLTQHDAKFGDDEWPQSPNKKRNKKRLMFAAAVPVLLVSVLLVSMGVHVLTVRSGHTGNMDKDTNYGSGIPGKVVTGLPFSKNHPVHDLGLKSFQRPEASAPDQHLFANPDAALPTNSWYQNILLTRGEPTEEQRVYPMPYLVDMVGPIPGLRLHHPTVDAGNNVIQLTQILQHGLTLGAASTQTIIDKGDDKKQVSNKFQVTGMTHLGVTLQWPANVTSTKSSPLTYSSSIVKGMPYATMTYDYKQATKRDDDVSLQAGSRAKLSKQVVQDQVVPTIVAEVPLAADPLVDGKYKLTCSHDGASAASTWVDRDVQLEFLESDFTWLVFVSRPVRVRCLVPTAKQAQPQFVPGNPVPSPGIVFALQFLDDENDKDSEEFIVRVAMANDCTYGDNPTTCAAQQRTQNPEAYAALLRQHANYYPGPMAHVAFDFDTHNNTNSSAPTTSTIKFDWDVRNMNGTEPEIPKNGLIMFALPHHQDMIEGNNGSIGETSQHPAFPMVADKNKGSDGEKQKFCIASLLGPVCLTQGSTWELKEVRRWTSFRAPRPPQNDTLPVLVEAFRKDLSYKVPSYYRQGAGDTYFSGKMLAKFGRILAIGEELYEVCNVSDSPRECHGLQVPSPTGPEFQAALASLRSSVEVWINGTAATPFVYDAMWGGVVSCGCDFDDKTDKCRNQFPHCPGFSDPGLNFGNAFYNDHHFHYGYHIYGAAVVAHFDPKWGRDHFDQVLLLVRDIANPSIQDTSFPLFRNKDWFQGSSWASGIAVSPLNGRNQESSSEAIAGYESVALYGMEMTKAWTGHDNDKAAAAQAIYRYGEVLLASEVRSADRYWHVIEYSTRRQYPVQYKPHVVGILWTTMAQFQTWFGSAAYLAYGIQLLPLTVASEGRDSIEWVRELYQPFADSCDANFKECREDGWSVLVLAMLATVGSRDQAIKKALELPSSVFESSGGNGHSLTNTIWYLSTRPHVEDPLVIQKRPSSNEEETGDLKKPKKHPSDIPDDVDSGSPPAEPKEKSASYDCSCPDTCNEKALNRFAFGHSCGERIDFLISKKDRDEWNACHLVGVEFPEHCAACDPKQCSSKKDTYSKDCPPCSKEVCRNDKLNLCPVHTAPFLCTSGASTGGCAPAPWVLNHGLCGSCCELTSGC